MQHFMQVATNHFGGGPAIQMLGAHVPIHDVIVHVTDHDRVLRLVEQRGLRPDLLLGVATIGDVARHDDETL